MIQPLLILPNAKWWSALTGLKESNSYLYIILAMGGRSAVMLLYVNLKRIRSLYNERARHKRLGRSSTLMAQLFRHWTLKSATQDRSPHSPLLVAAVTRVHLSGSFLPKLKVAQARGLGFQKGGGWCNYGTCISNWVVQVILRPNGLGFGLGDPGSIPARYIYVDVCFITVYVASNETNIDVDI